MRIIVAFLSITLSQVVELEVVQSYILEEMELDKKIKELLSYER